jgi:hypothetical protein
MRRSRVAAIAAILIALYAAPASSAIVVTKAGSRYGGYLLRRNDDEVVIKCRQPDGSFKEKSFPRAEVAEVLQPVKPERLETLSRDKAGAYRDYAEELEPAARNGDPEALDAALRLFLIAAALDPARLGSGSLKSMAALVEKERPLDGRRFRAMSFLLDPRHDREVLKLAPAAPAEDSDARVKFVRCLAYYRTGRTKEALKLAKEPGVEAVFLEYPGPLSQRDLVRSCEDKPLCSACNPYGKVDCPACTLGPRRGFAFCDQCRGTQLVACRSCEGKKVRLTLTDDDLAHVLRLELGARGRMANDPSGSSAGASWAAAGAAGKVRSSPLLSLETLTEFDPRKCHYRNGEWVEP